MLPDLDGDTSDRGRARAAKDVFLFVSEDSTVLVERRGADGTFDGRSAWSLVARRRPHPGATGITAARPACSEPSSRHLTRAGRWQTAAGPSRGGSLDGRASARRPPGRWARAVPGARPHARIRVDAQQLDDLVGLAGELVVLSDNLQGLREDPSVTSWLHALESLQRVSREIRDTTLDLRMVPVDELFSRFPRVVRDLADRSGKEIDLRIVGQETRLDRTIVERLGDPMVHLIRNAVDHVLRLPRNESTAASPGSGRITLTAGHEGDRVAIRVEDDGRGLDRERIVRKGGARGMIPPGPRPMIRGSSI